MNVFFTSGPKKGHYVPPTTPLDSTIYLCRESIRNEDSEDASTHDLKSPVALISGINESVTKEVIGKIGRETNSYVFGK